MNPLGVKVYRRNKNEMCANKWNHFLLQYVSAYNEHGFTMANPLHDQVPKIKCYCIHCLEEVEFEQSELEQFRKIYEHKLIVPANTSYNRKDRFVKNIGWKETLVNRFGSGYDYTHALKVKNQMRDDKEYHDIYSATTKVEGSFNTPIYYQTEEELKKASKKLLITRENIDKKTGQYYS